MKRTSPLDYIEVPTPCTAAWDDMDGDERVRFCTQCARSVRNLSAMTRPEAMKFIAHARGRVCIRYYRDPDGALHTVEPLVQIQTTLRRASRLAASAFSAALTLSASAVAQQPAANARADERALIQQTPRAAEQSSAGDSGYGSIAGTITDPNGAGIPNASVTLTDGGGNVQTAQTDTEGRFQFSSQPVGDYQLTVASEGFSPSTRAIAVQAQQEVRADTMLSLGVIEMGGVMAIAPVEPLVVAADNGDLPALQALLAKGSDVNVLDRPTDQTALMAATEDDNLGLVQLLLGAGADVNRRNEYGQTALMKLDSQATPELVRMLVTAGAKVNVRDKDGYTALMNLARWGNAETLRALCAAGAKVNARNHDGDTPLMLAAAAGDLENVRVLLQAGADVNRRNKEGQTALQQARANDHDEVVKLLMAYGSVVDPEEVKEEKEATAN